MRLLGRLSKMMGKSNGKFYVATIDVSNNFDVTNNGSFLTHELPTTYLIYRGSTMLEIKGEPTKLQEKEMSTLSSHYYRITLEENSINKILKEGKQCVEEEKYDEALYLFNEAKNLGKWYKIYGSTVLANLAYIQTKRNNLVSAKHYLNEYLMKFGESSYDEHEESLVVYAKQTLDLYDDYKEFLEENDSSKEATTENISGIPNA